MSTQTQQEYVVHLDIRARAADPDKAVQEALTQVQTGALANVVFSVEPVGAVGAADAARPRESADVPAPPKQHHPPREQQLPPEHHETYRGEFLG